MSDKIKTRQDEDVENNPQVLAAIEKIMRSLRTLMANKVVLAFIIKDLVPEFKDIEVREIIDKWLAKRPIFTKYATYLGDDLGVEVKNPPNEMFDIYFMIENPKAKGDYIGINVQINGVPVNGAEQEFFAIKLFANQYDNPYLVPTGSGNEPFGSALDLTDQQLKEFFPVYSIWINFGEGNKTGGNDILKGGWVWTEHNGVVEGSFKKMDKPTEDEIKKELEKSSLVNIIDVNLNPEKPVIPESLNDFLNHVICMLLA